MVYNFLKWLESQVTYEEFKTIVRATEEDIKFNRISFDKLTPPIEFVSIALRCANVVNSEKLGGYCYGNYVFQ